MNGMLRAEFIFKPIRRNACPLIERNERAQQHDSDVGCVPKNWLKVGWDKGVLRLEVGPTMPV